MVFEGNLKNILGGIRTEGDFNDAALRIFYHQSSRNPIYSKYLEFLGVTPETISEWRKIPFLPIEAFRHHRVYTGDGIEQLLFGSSGTTGEMRSRHYVKDPEIYRWSFLESFRLFLGEPGEFIVAALLPSYEERSDSSLIYMMQEIIKLSGNKLSGFYSESRDNVQGMLHKFDNSGRKVLLLGVSFALLDLAAKGPFRLRNTIVAETGGMKGRREEITREELHTTLCRAFGVERIYSEYGMTELLSQAWSLGQGLFSCPPWMRVFIREMDDPLAPASQGKTGGINIVDLANINSCSFIATQDIGKVHGDGTFEVLGRFDHSDIRGCNLMMS
jgi:phenylacetate-coenzyme A ligase PaaK-like adenylate-forming protein